MKSIIQLFFITIIFLISCEKEKPDIPDISTKITIITAETDSIGYRNAMIKGTLGETYGFAVQDFGHCWDTMINPEISKNKTSFGQINDTLTYSSQLHDLLPGKQYYVRAYFIIDEFPIYSQEKSFYTKSTRLPVVETDSVSSIRAITANCGGNILQANDDSIFTRGICWNTTGNPTIYDNKTTDGKGIGSFSSTLANLLLNTKYYVRAYATNSAGTGYGKELSFITKDGLPVLYTVMVTNITENSATSGGNIIEDWGFSVLERGVCWNSAGNPTTEDNKTSDGIGLGSFTSQITNLDSNTTYYVRSYASNVNGTGYGNQLSFKYASCIDLRDGRIYSRVSIGNQVWMAENLAYLPAVNLASAESYIVPYYYVYGYNGTSVDEAKATTNYATYGVLYNWPAAMAGAASSNSNPSGVQGICPDGWHLPSDEEWIELVNYLGGESIAGGKIKETGSTHWNSPNTGATNESGFTALPGGLRHPGDIFRDIGANGVWWATTATSEKYARIYGVLYDSEGIVLHYDFKGVGISVRCLKN